MTGRDATGGRTPRTVLGRRESDPAGPTGTLGSHRAPDGSDGGPVAVDLDRAHVVLVVGKRGYGKSYTLGVLAEGLARARGVAPVVLDPMRAFDTLADPVTAHGTTGGTGGSPAGPDGGPDPVPAETVARPRVPAGAVDPPSWPPMLGLSAESAAGAVVWRAAAAGDDLGGMRAAVEGTSAGAGAVAAAENHLGLAEDWGVFDPAGLTAADLAGGEATVLDASALDRAPLSALTRGIGDALYRARVAGDVGRVPWLLVDEAHAVFDGVGGAALERIATRGRAPGVGLALATQRPGAVPDAVVSQADLVVAHRLTARPDLSALERVRPTYVPDPLGERRPSTPGEATVVDDATESVHRVSVRERHTPHGGGSARATDAPGAADADDPGPR